MNESTSLRDIFNANYQGEAFQFPLDTSSTWGGMLLMLRLAVHASDAIGAVKIKIEELEHQEAFTPEELTVCGNVIQILELMRPLIDSLCKGSAIGMFMTCFDQMLIDLRNQRNSPSLLVVTDVVDHMAQIGETFQDGFKVFPHKMWAFWDPRIKHLSLRTQLGMDGGTDQSWENFLRGYVSLYYENMNYNEASNASLEDRVLKKIRDGNRAVEEFSDILEELEDYLETPLVKTIIDLLMWWESHQSIYPKLSLLARDFLSAPATSLPPEDIFTGKEDELVQDRFFVPYSYTRLLLCHRAWLMEYSLLDSTVLELFALKCGISGKFF